MKISIRACTRKDILTQLLSVLVISALFLAAYFFSFVRFERFLGGPVCLFRRLTSKPCMFCGLTASMQSVIELNFRDSFFQNPAGLIISVWLILILLNLAFQVCTKKTVSLLLTKKEKILIFITIFILIFINWISKF